MLHDDGVDERDGGSVSVVWFEPMLERVGESAFGLVDENVMGL